jgi:hypothetical protein
VDVESIASAANCASESVLQSPELDTAIDPLRFGAANSSPVQRSNVDLARTRNAANRTDSARTSMVCASCSPNVDCDADHDADDCDLVDEIDGDESDDCDDRKCPESKRVLDVAADVTAKASQADDTETAVRPETDRETESSVD